MCVRVRVCVCTEVRTFLRNAVLFLMFVSPLSNKLLEWESQGFLVPSCVVMIQLAVQTILSAIAVLPHVVITLALPVQEWLKAYYMTVGTWLWQITYKEGIMFQFVSITKEKVAGVICKCMWIIIIIFLILYSISRHTKTQARNRIYEEKLIKKIFIKFFPPVYLPFFLQ